VIELNAVDTGARLSCLAVERIVCEIWSRYFGRDVSPYDDFFDLGGDSLTMIDVVAQARARGLHVRSSVALKHSTPARLAESLTIGAAEPSPPVELPVLYENARHTALLRRSDWTAAESHSVPIVAAGVGEPLYVVHSDSHVEAEREAVLGWGCARPVNGFPLRGVRDLIPPVGTVSGIAGRLLDALRAEQAEGPYRLAGFGPGAVLAFEMARQLRDRGAQVALLALIRPPAVRTDQVGSTPGCDDLLRQRLAMVARRFGLTGKETVEEVHARIREDGWYDDGVHPWDLPWLQLAWADFTLAVRSYDPAEYDGPAMVFEDTVDSHDAQRPWLRAAKDAWIYRLDHGLESPTALIRDAQVAQAMRKALEA
jgi:thioesterase domain-containing protein/aryl carrier-like protein